MIRLILDLLPSNKAKQRKLAEEYFVCLLEHKVLLESSANRSDSDKEAIILDIQRRKRNIESDPNWRPEKWNFHKALYG